MNTNGDVLMVDAPHVGTILPSDEAGAAERLVVAIDFGTTMTSVAYVRYNNPGQRRRIGLHQVEAIDAYPANPSYHARCQEVPSELWFIDRQEQSQDLSTVFPTFDEASDESDNEDEDDDNRYLLHLEAQSQAVPISPPIDSSIAPAWGYEVQRKLKMPGSDETDPLKLALFKLMLDDTKRTEEVRERLSQSCGVMKDKTIIEKDIDIIATYLELLFSHVKTYLCDSYQYGNASRIEFVLCIPAVWKTKACRQMEIAMTTAIQKSHFGRLQNDAIDNLFIVTEPEAAAACVLGESNSVIRAGDTFVLLDAGGGTVDAVTYTVHREEPLRLETEAVMAGGDLCGSSFINKKFEAFLKRKLKNATYLNENGNSITSVINNLMVEFEKEMKGLMDGWRPIAEQELFRVRIAGLRPDPKLRFIKDTMCLTWKDVRDLFRSCLQGVGRIMINQLGLAKDAGHIVQKVILTGGFGRSHRLKYYLKGILEHYNAEQGSHIVLIESVSQASASSVARGAVLRTLKKEEGPARKLQCSFGFLRTERKGEHEEHASQLGKFHSLCGAEYIENTIDWFLEKGQTVAVNYEKAFEVEHTFALTKGKWLCYETLCMSDGVHRSHYGYNHPMNNGAAAYHSIEIDVTKLKEKTKPRKVYKGKVSCYFVTFTLVVTINGRNLRYEARKDGEVLGVGQTSLAPAFRPGTD